MSRAADLCREHQISGPWRVFLIALGDENERRSAAQTSMTEVRSWTRSELDREARDLDIKNPNYMLVPDLREAVAAALRRRGELR